MNEPLDHLQGAERALRDVVSTTYATGALRLADDDVLLSVLAHAAAVSRLADALMSEAVGQVQHRVDSVPHDERITTVHGCRSSKELVQRVTRASSRSTAELMRASRAVTQPTALTTGEALPAAYPALRAAFIDGTLGADALASVASTLDSALCAGPSRLAADEELAASARGLGSDGGPAPCADDLRLQAQVWAAYLDQDGAEPREARAMRKRGLTIGVCRDGLVPLRGNLLPEVAGQLDTLFHSILNPKGSEPGVPAGPHFVDTDTDTDTDTGTERGDPVASAADPRSRTQRQHDALATIFSIAARSGEAPTIGGAAPTLVVSVRADDMRSGSGHAHIDGCDEPVSLAVARHVACAGGVQRVVLEANGRIRSIVTLDRIFDRHQRKAIALRDGGCIIPGCHVPAAWCEIHHVEEHARGGPTATANGVLLCWHHHRTLDSGGWRVRMRDGVPEVRGPAWWDASGRWRTVTSSPVRMRERLRSRSAS